MELGHILWPSDPSDSEIQRPGDPVDPVTLFYNEQQMSTYVADKRLQWMGKRFASFYHCSAFARFWKRKFWRSVIKCQWCFYDGWTDFHKNIYICISLSWAFFQKPEKLGSHTGSKWWPGESDVKDDPNDPLTRWPNDPVLRLVYSDRRWIVECRLVVLFVLYSAVNQRHRSAILVRKKSLFIGWVLEKPAVFV